MLRSRLKPGMVVQYVLRPDQLPTSPRKRWRGRITHVYFPPMPDLLDVEVLNEGYQGMTERIAVGQIVRIEGDG
ncbi:MAG TPA: hypothetical protein VKT25_11760 [Ktedonobacteraceae bacterium]|nr:hypothetical protein [Ktedonobacteraceae bacterium]